VRRTQHRAIIIPDTIADAAAAAAAGHIYDINGNVMVQYNAGGRHVYATCRCNPVVINTEGNALYWRTGGRPTQ